MAFYILERAGEESVVAYFNVLPHHWSYWTKYLCQHSKYLEIRTGHLPTASWKRHRLSHPAQRYRWTSHENLPRNRNRTVKLKYRRSDADKRIILGGVFTGEISLGPASSIGVVLATLTSRVKCRTPEQYSVWRIVPGGNWPDSGKRIEKNRIQKFTLQEHTVNVLVSFRTEEDFTMKLLLLRQQRNRLGTLPGICNASIHGRTHSEPGQFLRAETRTGLVAGAVGGHK
jgi:hypothetical protein